MDYKHYFCGLVVSHYHCLVCQLPVLGEIKFIYIISTFRVRVRVEVRVRVSFRIWVRV